MKRMMRTFVLLLLSWVAGEMLGESVGAARLRDAQAFFDEGKALWTDGQYESALVPVKRALELREAALGPMHPLVAQCMSLMGIVQIELNDFAQAESSLKRSLFIRETLLGADAPETANSLNSLAVLHRRQGRFFQAEPLFQRALRIWELQGPANLQVARVSNNLAYLYDMQGRFEQAESLYKRAVGIHTTLFGEEDPRVATAVSNRALFYFGQGRIDEAQRDLERALKIREKVLSEDHPELADSLDNLATVYHGKDDPRAEPLMERALELREKALGRDHSVVASSLVNLASLVGRRGDFQRAELLLDRALRIQTGGQGESHPRLVHTLFSLAALHEFKAHGGRTDESSIPPHLDQMVPLIERALLLFEELTRREAVSFSKDRLTEVLRGLAGNTELVYQIVRMHPRDERVRRLALIAAFLRKNRSVHETATTWRTLYQGLDAADQRSLTQLNEMRSSLSHLSLKGLGSLPGQEYQHRQRVLRSRMDDLEAELARKSERFRVLHALPRPDALLARIAGNLPSDAVVMEFVVYSDNVSRVPAVPSVSGEARAPRYLALLLFPDGQTHAVDLGLARDIDEDALRLRDALANDLALGDTGPDRMLYQRVFAPLRPLLEKVGTRRVFLSPDGQLSLVPFAALHDGEGVLLDSFDISYLSSGKDLLLSQERGPETRSVVVLADPDFDAPRARVSSAGAPASPLAELSDARARWRALSGTRREAEAIGTLFKPDVRLLLGRAATAEALLSLRRPAVLHIATHGSFLEDVVSRASMRAPVSLGGLGGLDPQHLPEDPMLRSGLMFAGANAPPDAASGEDSRVTALELAGLDLWGTQLVVLSACDTGRGDVRVGQGVYGLRRALIIAGAQTVVTSLWAVKDDTTAELMEAYYGHLQQGEGRISALNHAMRELRQVHPEPSSWAPFIGLGLDAPLRLSQ